MPLSFSVALFRKGRYHIEFLDMTGYAAANIQYIFDEDVIRPDTFSEGYASGVVDEHTMLDSINRMRNLL